MPAIIEGEAVVIDDGRSTQQPILPSWLEPLPEAYKTKRAWIALGASVLFTLVFAFLSWKLHLLQQLPSVRGAFALLGVVTSLAIGIWRWNFWKTHPEVRRYAKTTPPNPDESRNLSDWLGRLRTDPLSELTPEGLADFRFYEAERQAELRQRWQHRTSWLVETVRAPAFRFPLAILILVVDFMLRYNHQISIIAMGAVLIVAVLVAYEMLLWFMLYVPIFFLVSRYIPYTMLVPASVAIFAGAMILRIAIKSELKN